MLVLLTGAATTAYGRYIGYPKYFHGHRVYPKVAWYEIAPQLPLMYPGEVYYGYTDASGKFIPHGPYVRRVWQSTYRHPFGALRIQETGTYVDGQRDGVFLEYQTYWNKLMARTTYVRGRQTRLEYPLFVIPTDPKAAMKQ